MTKNDTEPSEGTVRRGVLESDPRDYTNLAKVLSEEAGKANPSQKPDKAPVRPKVPVRNGHC